MEEGGGSVKFKISASFAPPMSAFLDSTGRSSDY